MKVNTDGVLLAAMARCRGEGKIMDVGTGTGVIAIMLAQRFPGIQVEALEPDEMAFRLAEGNFRASPFSARLSALNTTVQQHVFSHGAYSLIISNPPYFLAALKSPDPRKSLARHGNLDFFERLFDQSAYALEHGGELQLILPLAPISALIPLANAHGLYLIRSTAIRSFAHTPPFREVLAFSNSDQGKVEKDDFVIYRQQGKYSLAYTELLKDFFLHF